MATQKKPGRKQNGSRKKKVLFVDDEPMICSIVKRHLIASGREVRVAPNGPDGMLLARKWMPDIIVLDQNMPRIKGVETCFRLKRDKKTAGIPIIFFTAHMVQGFEADCIKAGALAIIYKPVVSELISVIEKILSGKTLD